MGERRLWDGRVREGAQVLPAWVTVPPLPSRARQCDSGFAAATAASTRGPRTSDRGRGESRRKQGGAEPAAPLWRLVCGQNEPPHFRHSLGCPILAEGVEDRHDGDVRFPELSRLMMGHH